MHETRFDRPGYFAWHKRLRRRIGAPSICAECGAPAREWALKAEFNVPGETYAYVEDPEAYDPLCNKCHRARDCDPARGRSISKAKKGRPILGLTAETIELAKNTPGSSRAIARELGIGYKVVLQARRGGYDEFLASQLG